PSPREPGDIFVIFSWFPGETESNNRVTFVVSSSRIAAV
ncbi:MAG: hypothetical protein QOE34_1431, partial [Verrucomicrobiota bacterium]